MVGFRGGSWNGYSNNFTIRNSDAHAWAEIFDAATGAWVRADALEIATSAQGAEAKGEAALAARTDRSWSARLDSLRVFWYRRIVNFDQRSQLETLKEVKERAQNSSRRVREMIAEFLTQLRTWLGGPWDAMRFARVLGFVALLGVPVWAWRSYRFLIFEFGFFRRRRREDPVRREAGRWLARLHAPDGAAPSDEMKRARAELQRLRFGASSTWPEPETVFRRARHAAREARRRRVTQP